MIRALPASDGRRAIVLLTTVVVGLAVLVGSLAAFRPAAAISAIAVIYLVAAFLALSWRLGAPFSLASFVVVGGYICLTRGFAGLYVPVGGTPLLIGELTLAVLTPIAVLRLGWRAPASLLLPFGAWIAYDGLLTIRDLPSYGLDALRDSAFWYYAGFVLIGAATWHELRTDRVRRWMGLLFAILTIVVPFVVAVAALGAIPAFEVPFADGSLVQERFDASSMHLIGAAALFLTARGMRRQPWSSWLGIAITTVALGLTTILQVRAAFVALAGTITVLVAYRLVRPVLVIGVALLLALAVLWALDVEMPTSRGVVSARTVVERQISTVSFLRGDVAPPSQEDDGTIGTIEWRTIWWQALIEESLANPTFLLIGRGFGPDLRSAVLDRAVAGLNWAQGEDEGKPVRSPHNIAVTIFARTGVVGLVSWLLVMAVSFGTIIRATVRFRRVGARDEELFGVWLIVYLLVMLLISLFGVVMESPFGAAPFYWTLGIGLAWACSGLANMTTAQIEHSGGPRRASSASPRAARDVRR